MKNCIVYFVLLMILNLGAYAIIPTDLPGAPENSPAKIIQEKNGTGFRLEYDGMVILKNKMNGETVSQEIKNDEAITQIIEIKGEDTTELEFFVYASCEALAAETRGNAQARFPIIRTSHGLSNNLRNNAIYDRKLDWMLEFPANSVIKSFRKPDGTTSFKVKIFSDKPEIIFRPRYYQKHKKLKHFQPWTYSVYKESVTGWCSWWAYFRNFTEKHNKDLLEVWQQKHFRDYGYRFIQIDDVYQGENDKERENCEVANGYLGGRPTTWLDWKKDIFPGGLTGYVKDVNKAGFDPALWMGCFFSDKKTAEEHPEWFVLNKEGKPASGPWVSYVLDATNPEVVETLIRPTFKGLKNAGIEYVKIDQLRHYLYDNLHQNTEWCKERGITPDKLIRAYLKIAREELGNNTFILSCWGVLPESIGLADACRIGGDGYGPVTLQQYNSWNGIVWRNDPDHCDVSPDKKAKDVGNVKETEYVTALDNETIIRPALASIAGAMLMVSDKPEVYKDQRNLFGLRRSSPVLFSVPGQLYDFDPGKTNWMKEHERTEITSGRGPSPIDGDQFGEVCPYWLNEFNTTAGNWHVLHRLNWSEKSKEKLPKETVAFKDLGLDCEKEYLVYEFWDNKMLGVVKNRLELDELEPFGLESFAIREKLDRPQLISTNRHLSQGAAEIEMLRWEENSLKGRSRGVINDEYVITLFVPDGYKIKNASANGIDATTVQDGQLIKILYLPRQTESITWEVVFSNS